MSLEGSMPEKVACGAGWGSLETMDVGEGRTGKKCTHHHSCGEDGFESMFQEKNKSKI